MAPVESLNPHRIEKERTQRLHGHTIVANGDPFRVSGRNSKQGGIRAPTGERLRFFHGRARTSTGTRALIPACRHGKIENGY